MPGPFAITASTNTTRLDDKRRAETSFTVFNTSGRQIRGRARIITPNPAAQSWISIAGEPERDFAIAGTQQFTLQIAVPPDAPAGSYPLRLDVVGVENPDEMLSEGPMVQFEVPAPVAQKKSFPIWIPIAAIAALAVVGIIAFLIIQNAGDNTQAQAATATAQAAGTSTALAGQAAATESAIAVTTQTALAVSTQTALAIATQTALAQALVAEDWRLIDFVSPTLGVQDVGGKSAGIQFTTGGQVNGFGGCNSFSARYRLGPEQQITIGNLISTLRICIVDVSEFERNYFQAIQGVTHYSIEDGRLELKFENGQGTLTYRDQ